MRSDPDGTLCFHAKSYTQQTMISFKTMFREKSKEYSSPMDKNDHPELDTKTAELPKDNIKKYHHSLICTLQLVVSLCCLFVDNHCAVTTMMVTRL